MYLNQNELRMRKAL